MLLEADENTNGIRHAVGPEQAREKQHDEQSAFPPADETFSSAFDVHVLALVTFLKKTPFKVFKVFNELLGVRVDAFDLGPPLDLSLERAVPGSYYLILPVTETSRTLPYTIIKPTHRRDGRYVDWSQTDVRE